MKIKYLIAFLLFTSLLYSQSNYYFDSYDESIETAWDSTSNDGKVKYNLIELPQCDIYEKEVNYKPHIKEMIKNELNSQLKFLRERTGNNNTSKPWTTNFESQTNYAIQGGHPFEILSLFRYTVNQNDGSILIFLIIPKNDEKEPLHYSRISAERINVQINCFKKTDDRYYVFGNSEMTSSFFCGGDFKIEFNKDKRLITYEYCQIKK